jgi:ketosteroid isomerase-like protein
MAKGWFASLGTDRDVVRFDDVQFQENNDLAIVTAIVRFTAVSAEGKELRFLEERLTCIAQRKNGIWKIIHQHTSTPTDFNSMKAILTR